MKVQSPESRRVIAGLRVLIVEDESLIAMQLEDMLSDLGCEVVGPAMRLSVALKILDDGEAIDVAVLDVNLGGDTVFPAAERLRALKVPLVFATGYGRQGVPEDWHEFPILQKPYTTKQIEDAILSVVT